MIYVVSDIHGCFDKLMTALDKVGFDAANDTLIVNGDVFDRGSQVLDCIRFINRLPHHYVILGNHEYSFLANYYAPEAASSVDVRNGRNHSLISLVRPVADSNDYYMGWPLQSYSIYNLVRTLQNHPDLADVRHELDMFFKDACFAIETTQLIITHAWLPSTEVCKMPGFKQNVVEVRPDWREVVKVSDWIGASWYRIGTYLRWVRELPHFFNSFYTRNGTNKYKLLDAVKRGNEGFGTKTMVIGHQPTWSMKIDAGVQLHDNDDDYSMYYFHLPYHTPNVAAIDGGAPFNDKGRVIVYAAPPDDEISNLYPVDMEKVKEYFTKGEDSDEEFIY